MADALQHCHRNKLPWTKLDSDKKVHKPTGWNTKRTQTIPTRSQKTFHPSRTPLLALLAFHHTSHKNSSPLARRAQSHGSTSLPLNLTFPKHPGHQCLGIVLHRRTLWRLAKHVLRTFGAHRPASDASTRRRHSPKTRTPTYLTQCATLPYPTRTKQPCSSTTPTRKLLKLTRRQPRV